MKNRAQTDSEKRAVVERLYAAWLKYPKVRLGQLLVGAVGDRDLFYVEDQDLVVAVEGLPS